MADMQQIAPVCLVLVPGAGCDKGLWPQDLAEVLPCSLYYADLATLTVHAGEIAAARGETVLRVEDYATALRDSLEQHVNGPYIVCGHSFGGAIALAAALQAPEKIQGLILVATGAKLRVHPKMLSWGKYVFLHRLLCRKMTRFSLWDEASPTLRRVTLKMFSRSTAQDLHQELLACDHFDIRSALSSILTPSLILHGREDRMTPIKFARYLSAKLPCNQLSEFENTAHMLPLEQPQRFSNEISTWLSHVLSPVT